jgi:hypothetical protein
VVLNGTASPLIKAQVGRGYAHLAGHELHSLIRKLATPAGNLPARAANASDLEGFTWLIPVRGCGSVACRAMMYGRGPIAGS